MAHEQSEVVTVEANTPAYPFITNLALTNGQFREQPGQYCVARCVCCRRVNVVVVRVHHGKIIDRLAEGWYEISEQIAPNQGGVVCPDCRPTEAEKEAIRQKNVPQPIVLPGLEAVKKYTLINERYRAQVARCAAQIVVTVIAQILGAVSHGIPQSINHHPKAPT